MIPGCIEVGALFFCSAFHFYYLQGISPGIGRILLHGVEIETGNFAVQVLTRILFAYYGDTHFGYNRLLLSEVSHRLQTCTLHAVGSLASLSVAHQLQFGDRLGELHGEEHILIVYPSACAAHTRKLVGIRLLDFGFVDELVVQQVSQVEHDSRFFSVAECVAVNTRTCSSRQLGLDAFIVQINRIVSRGGYLVFMREAGGLEDVIRLSPELNRHAGRAEQHIAQVDTSRTAEVGVRESQNGRIGIMVSRASIPVAPAGIRTQLHGTEGQGSSRISMSVEACSYERIYIIEGSLVGRRSRTCAQRTCAGCKNQWYFHGCIVILLD